jgi:hypothetical protein
MTIIYFGRAKISALQTYTYWRNENWAKESPLSHRYTLWEGASLWEGALGDAFPTKVMFQSTRANG